MILTKFILGLSSLLTFIYPEKITNFTNYKNKKIIINIWNIYCFTLFLNLMINLHISIIICNFLSVYYHVNLLYQKK